MAHLTQLVADTFIAIVKDTSGSISAVYVCQSSFPLAECTTSTLVSEYLLHQSFAKSGGDKILSDINSKFHTLIHTAYIECPPSAYVDGNGVHHLTWAVTHRYVVSKLRVA